MTRLLVYIAGPYSSSPTHGTRAAIDAAEILIAAGYLPLVPHTDLIWDIVAPHDAQWWYDYTAAFVPRCDVLLRLPGASKGADEEVRIAREHGLPVFEGSAEDFVVMYGVEKPLTVSGNCEVEIKPIIRRRRAR